MKRLCLISIFLFAAIGAKAQCVATPADPCVSVPQSILDRSAKAVDELLAARGVIAAFANERAATDAERAAYKNLAAVTDIAIAVLQKGLADRDTVITLQSKTLELYASLVEKMQSALDKPKTGWNKFTQTLKEIALLAAGVLLGGHR